MHNELRGMHAGRELNAPFVWICEPRDCKRVVLCDKGLYYARATGSALHYKRSRLACALPANLLRRASLFFKESPQSV